MKNIFTCASISGDNATFGEVVARHVDHQPMFDFLKANSD